MRHNLEAISFMIGSFKDVVKNFGKNAKSVQFFKNNLEGLANIGQINKYDISLVYTLLGCKNTDAVKWDITENKLNIYTQAMNYILSYNKQDPKVIEALIYSFRYNGNTLSKDMEDILRETFDIRNNKRDTNTVTNFGSINYNSNTAYKKKIPYNPNNIVDYLGILRQFSDMYIRVKNPNAVCSCDPTYYRCKISELPRSKVLNIIKDNVTVFEIGSIYEDKSDPCRTIERFNVLKNVPREIQAIDWKEFYNYIKDNNLEELWM